MLAEGGGVTDASNGADESTPTAVFISRQLLLADTVGRLVSQGSAWSVKVLDRDDPHLLHLAAKAEPSVVILDVDDHLLPGFELLSLLVARLPGAAVLVLGELDGLASAEALHRGARGCLTYAASPSDVADAMKAATEGRTAVGAAVLRQLVGGQPRPAETALRATPADLLTGREVVVLQQLAAGLSTREIAGHLGISTQTVRKHTQHILVKLGVHSKLEAAALAAREHLV